MLAPFSAAAAAEILLRPRALALPLMLLLPPENGKQINDRKEACNQGKTQSAVASFRSAAQKSSCKDMKKSALLLASASAAWSAAPS